MFWIFCWPVTLRPQNPVLEDSMINPVICEMTAKATRSRSHLCGYRYKHRIQVQFSVLSASLESGLPVLHLALSVWPFESNICVVQITHCPLETSLFSDLTGFIFPCESSQSHLNAKSLALCHSPFRLDYSVRGRFPSLTIQRHSVPW